jgi:hypothetical protein
MQHTCKQAAMCVTTLGLWGSHSSADEDCEWHVKLVVLHVEAVHIATHCMCQLEYHLHTEMSHACTRVPHYCRDAADTAALAAYLKYAVQYHEDGTVPRELVALLATGA